MDSKPETQEKKERALPQSVSKLAWLPFIIMFFCALVLLILSFLNGTALAEQGPVKLLNIRLSEHSQLIILAILLGISVLIPFWSYSLRQAEGKANYPLGLPKGSIRGIIALLAAVAYVILSIRHDAFTEALNIFILVIALYFVSRTAESGMEYLAACQKETEQKVNLKEKSIF